MKRYRPHTMTGWTKKMEESWSDHRVQGQGMENRLILFYRFLVRSINIFSSLFVSFKIADCFKSFYS
jgi:heme/copper-type cytochrome/quinol oxidase subunit 3